VSNLQKALTELYNGEISEIEVKQAEDNLLQFFKLLQKVQSRQDKLIKEKQSNINVKNYENNGSSH
jgi:hypothetical protein